MNFELLHRETMAIASKVGYVLTLIEQYEREFKKSQSVPNPFSDGIWINADGVKLKISDMPTGHIINAMQCVLRCWYSSGDVRSNHRMYAVGKLVDFADELERRHKNNDQED